MLRVVTFFQYSGIFLKFRFIISKTLLLRRLFLCKTFLYSSIRGFYQHCKCHILSIPDSSDELWGLDETYRDHHTGCVWMFYSDSTFGESLSDLDTLVIPSILAELRSHVEQTVILTNLMETQNTAGPMDILHCKF